MVAVHVLNGVYDDFLQSRQLLVLAAALNRCIYSYVSLAMLISCLSMHVTSSPPFHQTNESHLGGPDSMVRSKVVEVHLFRQSSVVLFRVV